MAAAIGGVVGVASLGTVEPDPERGAALLDLDVAHRVTSMSDSCSSSVACRSMFLFSRRRRAEGVRWRRWRPHPRVVSVLMFVNICEAWRNLHEHGRDGSSTAAAQGGDAGRPADRPGRHARGLKPGDLLEPERTMLEKYQTGRGTLREALRLLEFQGVILLKPGPRGGPVLQNPDAAHLGSTLVLLMQLQAAPFRNIAEVRTALEPMISSLAATRMTDESLTDLARDRRPDAGRARRPVLVPGRQQAVPRHHRLVVGQRPVRLHHRVAARDHGRHRDRHRLPEPSAGRRSSRRTRRSTRRSRPATPRRPRPGCASTSRPTSGTSSASIPQLLEQTIPWDQRYLRLSRSEAEAAAGSLTWSGQRRLAQERAQHRGVVRAPRPPGPRRRPRPGPPPRRRRRRPARPRRSARPSRMPMPESAIVAHLGQDRVDDRRGQAHRRLVEQHDPRLGHQGPAEGQHLLLAAAEQARRPRGAVGEDREHLVDLARGSRAKLDFGAV